MTQDNLIARLRKAADEHEVARVSGYNVSVGKRTRCLLIEAADLIERLSPPLDGEGVIQADRLQAVLENDGFSRCDMTAVADEDVTQDDRERWISLGLKQGKLSWGQVESVRNGKWDHSEEVQAFAAHRRASTISTPREDEVERVARAIAIALQGRDDDWMAYRLEAGAALATLTPREQIRAEAFEEAAKVAEVGIDPQDGHEPESAYASGRYAAARDIAKVIRALSSLPAPSSREQGMEEAWQPIETFAEPTALSSGNGVLVAEENGTVGEAYYRNFGDESDGWWWANTSWGDYPEPDRPDPTHWQPLPEPPALSLQDKT